MATDTHCHIFDEAFKDDYKECLKRAYDNGFKRLVLVGFHPSNNEVAYTISKEYDWIYPTAGLHPEYASELSNKDVLDLEEFIKTHKVYAVGECGLDYHWRNDNKDVQKELFIAQIKLALKYDLPLIIHSRECIQDIYDILSLYPGVRFVMHGFSGSVEMMKRFVKLGGYIGLGGPVTFKNAKEPKEVAREVPLDRLLIETDCPYLTPHPFRGKRNEPMYARYTLAEIAKIKEIAESELEKITDSNANALFRFE